MGTVKTMWGLAWLLAVGIWAGAAVAAPPAETFFRDPGFSQAKLSPDGRHVAMLVSTQGKRLQLAVLDLETLKPRAVAGDNERDIYSFHWVNDERLVYDYRVKLVGRNLVEERPGLFAVSVQGDKQRRLVHTTGSFFQSSTVDTRVLDTYHFLLHVPGHGMGEDIYVARAGEVSRKKVDYIDVKRVNTLNGRSEDVDLPMHAQDWVFGNDHQPLAVKTERNGQAMWQWRQTDGRWLKGEPFDTFTEGGASPEFQAADGQIYGVADHRGFAAVFVLDRATGLPKGAPLAAVPGFSIHPAFIANDQRLLGIRFTVDAEVTLWLDPAIKALQDMLDQALPDTSNRLSVPYRGDSPWVLVQSFSDGQPPVTRVYNRSSRKLLKVGEALPGLDPKQLGRTDFFRIKARDGLDLPLYLTLPAGGAKKRPTVLLVHGGPWVRGADWHFDPEVQFLASRGYAVLQPAFRGSTGYGHQHFRASFGQWGRAMQDDLMDALRWAVAQGYTDPQRVCIAGASYGGYAALMGLVRDGDAFRCAVSWVGVTDPLLLYDSTWSDITEESRKYGLNRMVGDPVADAERLKQVSPLHQAARIQKPLLLAYGGWDTRVDIEHGERLRAALKPHNPAVDWVVYPEEGHGWYRPETRIDFWTRVEKFLARHLAQP
jgi:dipeptidyl aminopeptidase/acylaminoacyl peptidase